MVSSRSEEKTSFFFSRLIGVLGEIEESLISKTTRTIWGLTSQATRIHKQSHNMYKYPAGIVRQYPLIMPTTPSLWKHTILSSFRNSVTFYLKLIGHLFQLASTYNKNHIHLLILCIGYSQYNCIKIQLAELPTGPSRYGQTTHKDSQEADKPVLPALDKILTLGRTNKLLLLSLNRIFRGR